MPASSLKPPTSSVTVVMLMLALVALMVPPISGRGSLSRRRPRPPTPGCSTLTEPGARAHPPGDVARRAATELSATRIPLERAATADGARRRRLRYPSDA